MLLIPTKDGNLNKKVKQQTGCRIWLWQPYFNWREKTMPQKTESKVLVIYNAMLRESQEDFRSYLFSKVEYAEQFLKEWLISMINYNLEKEEVMEYLVDSSQTSIDKKADTLEELDIDALELICCDYDLGYICLQTQKVYNSAQTKESDELHVLLT